MSSSVQAARRPSFCVSADGWVVETPQSPPPTVEKYGSIRQIHPSRAHLLTGPVVLTEKIHGAYFLLNIRLVNGKMVLNCGKRNGIIGPTENFFRHRTVLQKYEKNLDRLMEFLSTTENFSEISISGELHGGYYHGQTAPGSKAIQKSKFSNYCKENDFVVFDIKLNGKWLCWDEVIDFCKTRLQMNHVPEIARGSWEDIRSFNVDSQQSFLAEKYNGNDGEDNPIEGVVIRLERPEFTKPGERDIRFKWKCKEMLEGGCDRDLPVTDDSVVLMMNQPRFEAYLSKVGSDEIIDGNIGKHICGMVDDVFVDIREAYPDMDKKALKSYRTPLNAAARRLIFNYRFSS